jgi:hypothetical protein
LALRRLAQLAPANLRNFGHHEVVTDEANIWVRAGFDGPALVEPFNAEVLPLAPQERVAAVAASLESVWP